MKTSLPILALFLAACGGGGEQATPQRQALAAHPAASAVAPLPPHPGPVITATFEKKAVVVDWTPTPDPRVAAEIRMAGEVAMAEERAAQAAAAGK